MTSMYKLFHKKFSFVCFVLKRLLEKKKKTPTELTIKVNYVLSTALFGNREEMRNSIFYSCFIFVTISYLLKEVKLSTDTIPLNYLSFIFSNAALFSFIIFTN